MTSLGSTKPRSAALTWVRLGVSGLAIVLQVALFVAAVVIFSNHLPWVFAAHIVISFLVVVLILGSRMTVEYKLAWSIPILLMPLVGGVFYLIYGREHFSYRELSTIIPQWEKSRTILRERPQDVLMDEETPGARRLEHYLRANAGYPGFNDTEVTYYPIGEDVWEAMIAELKRAKRYILFQYFIISAGRMWDELHAVLAQKAAEGVQVRVLYDDLGSVFCLPDKFEATLRAEDIHVQTINPFGWRLNLRYNNRNHSKILVIDGEVGFTGGVNIGDEYINLTHPYGHWKDSAVRLRGPAVHNLAVMFTSVWNAGQDDIKWSSLLPQGRESTCPAGGGADRAEMAGSETQFAGKSADQPVVMAGVAQGQSLGSDAPTVRTDEEATFGWVQPYDDSPYDRLTVGRDAYITLLSSATKTVDITSPYLIVDSEMSGAIMRTARAGVRVRIITPHIGDSWFVHETTRSAYLQMVEAGVEIYEYEPGYMHAKMMIADGLSAIIGTINLDYRSLHLHQECAVWLHRVGAINDMSADFEKCLAQSLPMTLEVCRQVPWWRRVIRVFLRILAPLM